MKPVKSNIQSKTCANPIGTDCVIVSDSCGPVSLTTKLLQLEESADCCLGTFPPGHSSAYTGEWVDFSSSIPLSGTASGSGSGGSAVFTVSAFGAAGSNRPQYFWTKEGNIKLRGNLVLDYTPSISRMLFSIPLHTFPIVNFPAGFTAAQRIQAITVDPANTNAQTLTTLTIAGLTMNTTGTLNLDIGTFNSNLVPTGSLIEFGGITFNLA